MSKHILKHKHTMPSIHSKLVSGALIEEAKQWRDSNDGTTSRLFIASAIDADAIEEQLIINGFKLERKPCLGNCVQFTLIK